MENLQEEEMVVERSNSPEDANVTSSNRDTSLPDNKQFF